MTDLMYNLGDIFTWTFKNVLELLGNVPNVLFIIIGFVGTGFWLMKQTRYNREAKENGTLI
jgi:hypothetical protein